MAKIHNDDFKRQLKDIITREKKLLKGRPGVSIPDLPVEETEPASTMQAETPTAQQFPSL